MKTIDNYRGKENIDFDKVRASGTKETAISDLQKAADYVGARCKELQQKLIFLGYNCGGFGADGKFGEGTYNSLIKFQKDYGLVVDGLAGEKTFQKLDEIISQKNNVIAIQQLCNRLNIRDENGNKLIEDGIIGRHTKYAAAHLPICSINYKQPQATLYIQKKLSINADSIFGSQTANAVKAWQKKYGLLIDGIVGPQTWISFLNN